MNDLYPTDFKEWLALSTLLAPVFIGVFAAAWKVLTYHKEWKAQQWRRFQDLTAILYNNNGLHGGWAQIVALREIEAMAVPKSAKLAIFRGAAAHFATGLSPQVEQEAKNVVLRNSGCRLKQEWHRWRTP